MPRAGHAQAARRWRVHWNPNKSEHARQREASNPAVPRPLQNSRALGRAARPHTNPRPALGPSRVQSFPVRFVFRSSASGTGHEWGGD
jgi:hypothetical protein